VPYKYQNTGLYYSTSMGLTIITEQVHIIASLCDLQLSPIHVHLTLIYVTYHYHHTIQVYFTVSLWD
jgi:hypothetical protein